jgi:DNA polymerase-3 subunit gamma/tau
VDDGEPCGECASCTRIWSGSASLDVVEIDAASNRGVDDARDLRERAMYAPTSEGRYKVYIVDEAHMLTREAWNALLKILEEPPPHVVFVFATTEPQKIAQAAAPVLSRLQRFDFRRISPADVRDRLAAVLSAERVQADADALGMLARAADGSMRDALSLTDQVLSVGDGRITAARVREALGLVAEDEYLAALDVISERRAADVFPMVARLADAGVDLAGFLGGLADMLRAQLAVTLGGEVTTVSDRARDALRERAGRLSSGDLLRMLTVIGELEPRFRRSGQQQLLLETLLVRFALLDRTVSLEDVLRGLGSMGPPGERRIGPPPPARGATPAAGARDGASRAAVATPGTAAASDSRPATAPPSMRRAGAGSAAGEPAAGEAQAAAGEGGVDLNRLVEQWGDVIARARAVGRTFLATALEHVLPVAVSARGDVTLELDEPNDVFEEAIASDAASVLSAIGAACPGARRVAVRRSERATAGSGPPRRLSEEAVKEERLAALRRRDPALDAAIEELDLELLD